MRMKRIVLRFVQCVSFFVFVFVLYQYFTQGWLIDIDHSLMAKLYQLRSDFGVHFFLFVTLGASPAAVLAVVGYYLILFFREKQIKRAVMTFFGLMCAEAMTAVLKIGLHRARPDLLLRAMSEDSFSLPSGSLFSLTKLIR